ncbi:cyclic nucleotide-binding domain-containing protein [Treponema brennaborense]|uniref:Transcriptional regulator, Crp/Fnr family n=1 Tax=Treponema brennaborense (strain DSM 12168 / CIP 105900 / DD5/3) TaxID=906968 RepID=F4LN24_TREBD|nr:cyclic nucleotide-binding domain-containing protein [Treponema brennaborense]AEE15810.1 putative transcriptional regulator, Crp/Fnr family [Treponema brennaborense DSM 12168]
MKKILVYSDNDRVIHTVKSACKHFEKLFEPVFFIDAAEAVVFMDYELPEIKILDFSADAGGAEKVLAAIDSDPWLHNGGVIAVTATPAQAQEAEDRKNPNILITQTMYTFTQNFTILLGMLWQNQQFLFTRRMQEQLGAKEQGQFVCGNNPIELRLYTGFLVNYLYCSNRISNDDRFNLFTTLMELLTNALEHGNCEISYQDKSACLEAGGNILELIAERNADPVIAARKIRIDYVIGAERSEFRITDQGAGFDWRSHVSAAPEETHGRGIRLSSDLVKTLSYNEKGNSVSFSISNVRDSTNSVPVAMKPYQEITFAPKQIVCRQNELTNDLYFIVSGRYAVYSNNRLVHVLTPRDMFIGEMSFLLNDRRSASLMSADTGKLIKIPKIDFLQLLRKYPHYGLFLSKLLAARLQTQTQKTVALQSELSRLNGLQPASAENRDAGES